jgi:hypothetical protein
MAFLLKMDRSETVRASDVAQAILDRINASRFRAEVDYQYTPKYAVVRIDKVRLRAPKPYCGNHPDACERGPHTGGDRKAAFLEGADWVSFNDMINDILDTLGISADVASLMVHIRDGRRRRVVYESAIRAQTWRKRGADSHYVDYIGKGAPPSIYPSGTPGEYTYR